MAEKISTGTTTAQEAALDNLRLVLTSPRPRAPDTLTGYLSVGRQYLTWLEDRIPPSEMDLRRYFLYCREHGKKDNSLRTTYVTLKKLYKANNWDWPLAAEDCPEAPAETNTPAFTREEVDELIKNRELYSKGECFYLAIATTYIIRRAELSRIKKRDIKGNTIYVDTAHGGRKQTHLIPDEIMPYIEAYHPKAHNVSALTFMFGRICQKGLGEKKRGYGWNSFRRTLDTLLPIALAKADKPLTYVGYYAGWSQKSIGRRIFGAPMAGVYARPDILSSDPFFVDREIFQAHPFLSLWADGGNSAPQSKSSPLNALT